MPIRSRRSAARIGLLSQIGCIAGACALLACGRLSGESVDPGVRTGGTCQRTSDCRGGDFCDRGTCARVATDDQFGHGYGAQCAGGELFSDDPRAGTGIHCRSYECVDGHCSSCVSDAECDPGYLCVSAPVFPQYPGRHPDFAGKQCVIRQNAEDPPVPCCVPENPVPCFGPTRPELPEPTLLPNVAHDCQELEDCRGDEFCDRGRCTPILVDQDGHGFGARLVRREAPSLADTCMGYLSIGRSCSSCLGDSECYSEAPYCIHHPYRPEARSCAPHPEAEYYDEAGRVAPHFTDPGLDTRTAEEWLFDYRAFLDDQAVYRRVRAETGLPVPPEPPPIADARVADGGPDA